MHCSHWPDLQSTTSHAKYWATAPSVQTCTWRPRLGFLICPPATRGGVWRGSFCHLLRPPRPTQCLWSPGNFPFLKATSKWCVSHFIHPLLLLPAWVSKASDLGRWPPPLSPQQSSWKLPPRVTDLRSPTRHTHLSLSICPLVALFCRQDPDQMPPSVKFYQNASVPSSGQHCTLHTQNMRFSIPLPVNPF